MEVVIKGQPDEIAALVFAAQERRPGKKVALSVDGKELADYPMGIPLERLK